MFDYQRARSHNRINSVKQRDVSLLYDKATSVQLGRKYKTMKDRLFSLITKQMTSNEFNKKKITQQATVDNIYIRKFIELVLRRKKDFQYLNEYQFQMIGDISSSYSQHQVLQGLKNNLMVYVKKQYLWFLRPIIDFFKVLDQKVPLFQPESNYKIFLDINAICARLYFLYLIPIDLAWTKEQLMYDKYFTSTIVMLLILIVDVIIGLNTAYYESGFLVTSRKDIIKANLVKRFGLEWISTILLIVFLFLTKSLNLMVNINSNSYYLVQLLFLIHHLKVHEISEQYERPLKLRKQSASILELLKYVLFIFYCIHLFSCLWFWAGEYSQNHYSDSWLNQTSMENKQWDSQYLTSFYYASVTMFTVGYGDITPKSDLEKILSIIFIMIASIQLPYSINIVGNIIQEISAYGQETKNKLRTINHYMYRKKVPKNLQYEIRQYLMHYWLQQGKEETLEEKEIVQQLSEDLRGKLMVQANKSMLDQTSIFQKYFSEQIKQTLLTKIQVQVIKPENLIQYSNENEPFLCFIEEGEIEVFIEQSTNIKLRTVQSGESLGLYSFITGTKPLEKFRSIGFSKLLILSRSDFINVLQESPSDYEIFCKLKDELLFDNNSLILSVMCYACGSYNHKLLTCPVLHYIPDRELILKSYIYSCVQDRKKYALRNRQVQNRIVHSENDLRMLEFQRSKQQYFRIYQQTLQQQNKDEINYFAETEDKGNISLPKLHPQLSLSPFNQNQMNVPSQKEIKVQELHFQKNLQQSMFIKSGGVSQYKQNQNWLQKSSYKTNIDMTIYDNGETFEIEIIDISDQIKKRYDYLKQMKHKNEFKSELEKIEILYLKQRNLQRFDRKLMDTFDQRNNLQIYYPHENCNVMIAKSYGNVKLKRIGKQISKFIPYLLYPGQFIKKFDVLENRRFVRLEDRIDKLFDDIS